MRILCTAKDSHIFSTKNNSVFVTLADICLGLNSRKNYMEGGGGGGGGAEMNFFLGGPPI